MRFGVLGPLAVWTAGGEPVIVPGVKVRSLLADLLVHLGQPVSADRLVEDLWGDQPPGNPAGALQAKVSQLRRALEDAEPGSRELVRSGPSGYLLRAGAETVDAGRFAALTTQARAAGDPREQALLLTHALQLWRGPALADFADQPFAAAAVTRLEEQRLAALEEQAEARLALGEHAALVPELGELVARHPLRERLRAAQLRALYRAGRQSEALASYAALREHLAGELGLDPSPELAGLHRAILNQDSALAAPRPASTRPPGAGSAFGPPRSGGAARGMRPGFATEPGAAVPASRAQPPGSPDETPDAGPAGSAPSDGQTTGVAEAANEPATATHTSARHTGAEGAGGGHAGAGRAPSVAAGGGASAARMGGNGNAGAARPRSNLPVPLTGLVGRDEALAEVRALVGAGRLVTLTGPGGVGKTRLAMAAAAELVDAFADGAWLVELAALNRPGGAADTAAALAEAVMTVLGIRDAPGGSPAGERASAADRLATALRSRRLLLVVDSCEHVIEAVAGLVARLLPVAPGLRLLATSREPLGVAGEALWPVSPLDLPDLTAGVRPSDIAGFGAVRLFVERATAAAPRFRLDDSNAEAVVQLCRRLDGLPLAMELAATRVRALGVHGMIARLDDRFRLLATGYRGAPPRQQTLRAMIDWSWELLGEPERAVLRRLAVHADGCTLAAAEAVCAGDGVAADDVLDLLARLVDRCMVTAVEDPQEPGVPRYRLLESVAEYCRQRLDEAGEHDQVRGRHHRYYAGLAERATPCLRGREQRDWLRRLDREAANLRAALDGAVAERDEALALRLANALAWYWFLRGRLREALRSLGAALAIGGPGEQPRRTVAVTAVTAPSETAELAASRATAAAWQTGLALLAGDRAGPAAQVDAVLAAFGNAAGPAAIGRAADPAARAQAHWFLGFALSDFGDPARSEELVRIALDGFGSAGDRWGLAAALSTKTKLAMIRGDLAAVRECGERSHALFVELGDRWGQLQATEWLGELAEVAGDYREATRLHTDGLRMAEELGLWPQASDRLSWLGRCALLAGDYPVAQHHHERAMRLAVEQSYKPGEVFARMGLGFLARRQGRLDEAERHLLAVLEWSRQAGFELGVAGALTLAELGFAAEQRGDPAAARRLHLDGLAVARSLGDPRAVALALEGLAGADALAGHPDRAAVLLGAAAAARESVGAPLPPAERGDVDRAVELARHAVGEAAFAAGFDHGHELAPEVALARFSGTPARDYATS